MPVRRIGQISGLSLQSFVHEETMATLSGRSTLRCTYFITVQD